MLANSMRTKGLVLGVACLVAVGLRARVAAAQAPSQAAPAPAELSDFEIGPELTAVAPGGLTHEKVAKLAASRNLQVAELRARLAQADAAVVEAASRYVPQTELTARATRLSPIDTGSGPGIVSIVLADPTLPSGTLNPTPTVSQQIDLSIRPIDTQYELKASVQVPLSDYLTRVAPLYRSAVLARDAGQRDVEAMQLSSSGAALELYFAWLLSRAFIVASQDLLGLHRAYVASLQERVKAGLASEVDLHLAETNSFEMASQLSLALQHEAEQKAALRYAIGADAGDRLVPAEGLADGAQPVAGNLPALLALAAQHRRELQSLQLNVGSARARQRSELSAALPSLSAYGDATYSNPGARQVQQTRAWAPSWSVGVLLRWVPSDIPGAVGHVNRAAAQAHELELSYKRRLQSVTLEVQQAYFALEAGARTLALSARRQASSELAYRSALLRFQSNAGDALSVTRSLAELGRARLDQLTARAQLSTYATRLELAVGAPIPR
jgi:outer membrane protein TolC